MQIKNIYLTLSLLLVGLIANAQITGNAQIDTLQSNHGERFILQSKYQSLYLMGDVAWVGIEYAKSFAIDNTRLYFGEKGALGTALDDINEDFIPVVYPKGQYFDAKGNRIPANQQRKTSWHIIPSGDGEWVYLRSYWNRYLTVGGINKTGKFAVNKQWTLMAGEMQDHQKWRLIRVQ